MAKPTGPTMGTSASSAENISGAPSKNTKPVKRKSTATGGATGTKANRKGVLERNGFKGAPQMSRAYGPEYPEKGRNVVLVPRAKGNRAFYARRAEGPALVGPPFPPGHWQYPSRQV